MKLLLTSGGFFNKSIINALSDLLAKPFKESSLAFIPTAANVEIGGKEWLIKDLKTCDEMGFASVDIVDISAISESIWLPRLQKADVLVFGGGNTFYLRYQIKKSGLETHLRDLLKTRVYVGISAGSIVTGPNLKTSTSNKEYFEETNQEWSYDGLSLVDFHIRPHVGSADFPGVNFEWVKNTAQELHQTVYGLDDQSALKVIDGKVHVVSEGTWEKFTNN